MWNPLKQFSEAPGAYGNPAAAVTPLGLLHMRPLQHWLHSRVPRWAWRRGTLRVGISQQCRRSLSPLDRPCLSTVRGAHRQVSRHTFVTTDASSTGWGACMQPSWDLSNCPGWTSEGPLCAAGLSRAEVPVS